MNGILSVHLTLYMQAEDIEGVELCGTLKNIVAIAAGFLAAVFCLITSIGSFLTFNWLILRNYLAGLVDGLDMGNNTKVEKLLFNTFKKIKKTWLSWYHSLMAYFLFSIS